MNEGKRKEQDSSLGHHTLITTKINLDYSVVFTNFYPCCLPKHLDATNNSQSEHLKLCPLQIIVLLPCVEKVFSYVRYFAECKAEGQSDIEVLLEEF